MRNQALSLYRDILRLHRSKLPSNLRILGDDYIKKEFRLHKTIKDEQVFVFLNSWKSYAETLRKQSKNFGYNLDSTVLQDLGPEQLTKLEELKSEAKKAFEEVKKG